MEFKELCDLIECTGHEYMPYIKQGMNTCLGIVCVKTSEVVLDLISEYLGWCNTGKGRIAKAQDLCEQLKNFKVDSFGLSQIIYWPHIEWPGFVDRSSELGRNDYDIDLARLDK